MTSTETSTVDAIHDKALERARRIVTAFVEAKPNDLESYDDAYLQSMAIALGATFQAAADELRDEADAVAEAKKRGHQSLAKELQQVAARVVGIAQDLAELAKLEPPAEPAPTLNEAQVAEVVDVPTVVITLSDDEIARDVVESGTKLIERYTQQTDPVTSHADVVAYLKGDTEELPDILPPECVARLFNVPEHMLEVDPSALDRLAALPDFTPNREAAMTLRFEDPLPPSEAFRPQLPPGVSAADRRSFADLMQPVDPARFPDHWSWSQLTQSEDCGVQSRLSRLEGVRQVPQWANVGGTAFHAVSEAFDRGAWQAGGADRLAEVHPELITQRWNGALEAEIRRVAEDSGIEPGEEGEHWRASQRGKENLTWWKVEGERMLAGYIAIRRKLDKAAREAGTLAEPFELPRTSALPDGMTTTGPVIAVELDYVRPQSTPVGVLQVHGVIDRAYRCSDGSIMIKDLKTSSRVDGTSTGQLGEYAWALMYLMFGAYPAPGQPVETIIRGCFYDARKQIFTEPVDLRAKHPYDEYVFRYGAGEAHRRIGIMQPHKSSFCVSCSVAYACPIGGA